MKKKVGKLFGRPIVYGGDSSELKSHEIKLDIEEKKIVLQTVSESGNLQTITPNYKYNENDFTVLIASIDSFNTSTGLTTYLVQSLSPYTSTAPITLVRDQVESEFVLNRSLYLWIVKNEFIKSNKLKVFSTFTSTSDFENSKVPFVIGIAGSDTSNDYIFNFTTINTFKTVYIRGDHNKLSELWFIYYCCPAIEGDIKVRNFNFIK